MSKAKACLPKLVWAKQGLKVLWVCPVMWDELSLQTGK